MSFRNIYGGEVDDETERFIDDSYVCENNSCVQKDGGNLTLEDCMSVCQINPTPVPDIIPEHLETVPTSYKWYVYWETEHQLFLNVDILDGLAPDLVPTRAVFMETLWQMSHFYNQFLSPENKKTKYYYNYTQDIINNYNELLIERSPEVSPITTIEISLVTPYNYISYADDGPQNKLYWREGTRGSNGGTMIGSPPNEDISEGVVNNTPMFDLQDFGQQLENDQFHQPTMSQSELYDKIYPYNYE